MTDEQAKKLAKILASADGGCGTCGMDLAAQMPDLFPQFNWEALVREAHNAVWSED